MTNRAIQSVIPIGIEALLPEVDALRSSGWRLVQVLCVGSAEGAELSYSFGLALEMRSLRIAVPAEANVPSITPLFPGAFLYENEIRDLFGVRIERIRSDWEGKVYDVAKDKPFSKVTIKAISSEKGDASIGGIASTGGGL
jgi:ech hydrogenase subunit D